MASIAWEPCVLAKTPDPALAREVRKQLGFLPDYFDYFTVCPWVARQFAYWDLTNTPILSLPPRLVEMIDLVVAQDNSCRYCYAATTFLLRALGFDDAAIRAIEQDVTTAALPPATRAALDVARRLSRANPMVGSDELAALAAHGFDRHAVREIVYVAALMVLANRVTTIAAIPVDGIERLSRRWWVRLLSPAMGFLTWRARRRWRPMPLPETMRDGPFREVVRAFDGHPLGPRLWTQIDEAWRSEILPRRTKALIAAVIGRALGCPLSEAEARRLLAIEGTTLDLDAVLANLASPELTDAEAVIVPFVRETVHYSPAQIQRRARVVFEGLGQAAFIETVAIAALANALCRMTAALVDHPA